MFRHIQGNAREMGLGSLNDVNLGEARKRATECRRLRSAGTDPIEARKGVRDLAKLASVRGMTFAACAEAYLYEILISEVVFPSRIFMRRSLIHTRDCAEK
jgi:hypothetical protein